MLERIPERLTVSIERETFPRMLEEPSRLYAMASDAYWIDIGTPEKYLQAHADVLAGALWAAAGAGCARDGAGRVGAGRRADIDPDARARSTGRCSATGRVVDAGARVAGSVVGAGAIVGAGRARAALGGARRRRSSRPTPRSIDSVLGADATLGVGAIASDHTIVGTGAMLDAGARASGARVRRPEPEPPEPPVTPSSEG